MADDLDVEAMLEAPYKEKVNLESKVSNSLVELNLLMLMCLICHSITGLNFFSL